MRLDDIQECRSYARLLKLKTRLQIADGDLDGAIETLQTGYALARHVACGETFIHALVGMSISGLMNEEVEERFSSRQRRICTGLCRRCLIHSLIYGPAARRSTV